MESLQPEELVRRCQQTLPHDPRAFELLVNTYQARVYATAYRMMGNTDDADDIAQEVFIRVYHGIKKISEPAALTSWIYQITTNLCLDALAKRKRRSQRSVSTLHTDDSDTDGDLMPIDRQSPTPEEAALRRELYRCIAATLSNLSPIERAVIVLRDIENRSYQEIAEGLTMGLSAIKMRIHRARLAFGEIFVRTCPGAWRATETRDSSATPR